MDNPFHTLRALEFSRLDANGQAYLDYTGSGLYAESQVRAHAELLCCSVLGNPHSKNPTSRASTEKVEAARRRVGEFFHADPDEYEIVFTPNASGALKLVAESYGFGPGSRLLLTADNHNSVHGMREYAHARGAEMRYLPLEPDLRIRDLETHLEGVGESRPNLFVYPAQSNFSGVKHPLEWTALARARGYDVFLDAAAFAPTNRLSLREIGPDFVCLSFYKMFGFPTGVGALIARREALARLRRPWFAGGTVRFVSAGSEVTLCYPTARGFEDGTVNFLDIAAVPAGLDFVERVGMDHIHRHVMRLTGMLLDRLRELAHSDGARLVRVYGPPETEARGGTISFNVLNAEGDPVDFRHVERRASEAKISLRTGYFCNPGAAEFAFGHEDAEVRRCASPYTPETFTLDGFSVCLGDKPVGAVRVSLGIASNERDIERLVEVLEGFRNGADF